MFWFLRHLSPFVKQSACIRVLNNIYQSVKTTKMVSRLGLLTRPDGEFLNRNLRSPHLLSLLLWLAGLHSSPIINTSGFQPVKYWTANPTLYLECFQIVSWLFMDLKRLAAYYDQVDHPETHRSILSWLMIVENIISFVCGLPWGKTEFWIMPENFGFEWIFLEPTRWKWLNMEIFKLSFSNWLLRDKELRGNTEIEGENDRRISAFANCNVKLSCCQYLLPD